MSFKVVSTPHTLLWRHNDRDSVSNHQPRGCLLSRLFRRRSKKTSKLRVTGLCVGNSPGPVNSPHKGPVTRKMFPFDDVIMRTGCWLYVCAVHVRNQNREQFNKLNLHHRHWVTWNLRNLFQRYARLGCMTIHSQEPTSWYEWPNGNERNNDIITLIGSQGQWSVLHIIAQFHGYGRAPYHRLVLSQLCNFPTYLHTATDGKRFNNYGKRTLQPLFLACNGYQLNDTELHVVEIFVGFYMYIDYHPT